MDLPYMLINGKQRAAYYEREKALLPYGSNKLDGLYTFTTQSEEYNTPHFIRYSVNIPLQSWMKNASLLLRQLQVDCCSETLLAYDVMNPNIGLTQNASTFASNTSNLTQKHVKCVKPDYTKCVNYVKPEVEPVKTRVNTTSAYLNHPQNKTDVFPFFASNASELKKVHQAISPILEDSAITSLSKITIHGFASPEGPYNTNQRLSKERAFAFREYLKKEYNLKDTSLFEVYFTAEDWDTLIRLINEHPTPAKKEILSIIRKSKVPDERELKMKQLNKGVPYNYVYKSFYPKLRRIDIAIYYNVKPLSDSLALRLLYTNPKLLSLEEFFSIGNKAKPGSRLYTLSFDTAARFYPNEPVANINAAAAALAVQDTGKAREYLAKTGRDKRAYNNLGVYFLQTGDLSKAERYFRKALKTSPREAKRNLNLLEVKKRTMKQQTDKQETNRNRDNV